MLDAPARGGQAPRVLLGPRRRHLGRSAACAVTVLLGLAAPAPAAALETVVQDDATLLHRPAQQVAASMARLRGLGVDRVRLTANWSVLTRDADATRRPAFDATDPAAYEQARWRGLDRAVLSAREAGLAILLDVGFWAPHWATHDPPGPRARTDVDPADYSDFVTAVLRRYDGTFAPAADVNDRPDPSLGQSFLDSVYGPTDDAPFPQIRVAPLPVVRQFALWNEPNHPSLLLPQWTHSGRTATPASPALYRRMLAAAVPAARAVRPDAQLLVGNTSSSGGRIGTGAVAPLRFLRELACVDRALRPLRTPACTGFRPIQGDGWAHHPYSRNRRPDLPAPVDRPDDVGISGLGKLSKLLDALAARGRINPSMRQIHLTEFGYETEPVAGRPTLSQATQARWITWAERLASEQPHVVSFAQFLLRDQPPAPVKVSDSPARAFGQFATGLEEADGTPKLAASSFVAGLFARERGPREASLWVRLRLGSGPRTVTVEEARDAGYVPVATRPATGGPVVGSFTLDGGGITSRVVARGPGARYRLAVQGDDGTDVRGVDVPVVGAPPPAPRH